MRSEMESSYELLDHTADLGVRVTAPTLTGLVPPAVAGFYATLGRIVPQPDLAPSDDFTFEAAGDDPAVLLRDLLAELLHRFDTRRQVLTDALVSEFSATRLAVTGRLRPLDAARSAPAREVKAVTYHELGVRPVPGGYEATFIVDI